MSKLQSYIKEELLKKCGALIDDAYKAGKEEVVIDMMENVDNTHDKISKLIAKAVAKAVESTNEEAPAPVAKSERRSTRKSTKKEVEVEAVVEDGDISSLPKSELLKRASALGLRGLATSNKAAILTAIEGASDNVVEVEEPATKVPTIEEPAEEKPTRRRRSRK